ncbi:proline dehydrogenase family protein [Corynebacterium ammoniagenes]|uniref:L-glutamate gamma-semialdehyde dehydrogenase n=1 Tax=Corynebacterium ammoniagenes DSM 20306 TaxID=649754 RepID=A0ABN0AEI4_CORAM|nr:bifunctional proline dehydrogenase/L-glutamate gamma-semialdehyde dehydrogenase [Corynebacterium ammoniagenes]APT83513.1 aldehyde dehydrogenase [Corynebacterium ammoniagenes DSM 20306]AQS74513.1 aldehyde dehydrogenase [Corynebacterium ammoniagenes]EFG81140.1 aldehyde dehydrogenase (NAD) family protein [Corynebacterium ammoniagenes DSM 20306]
MTTAAHTRLPESDDVEAVVEAAAQRARTWLTVTEDKHDASTEQLAALLRDEDGVAFTMDFVDRVMRPEDDKVAADALQAITEKFDPAFLGRFNGLLIGMGGFFGPILPNLVMPLARMRMRQMVGHLVLDAESDKLNKTLAKAAESGEQLNLNLLGEAVLGEDEARSRAERTLALIRNPLVTYVSVKASSMVAQLNPWDIEGSLKRLKKRLLPLYDEAAKRSPNVFINLDMEEYHDLHLTIRLFKELLSEPRFKDLETGIVLQAYLPDTFDSLVELADFALERVAAGGAPIKIRFVKGANLSMEHVQGEVHGWPAATYLTKDEVDANYYRLLDYILRPEFKDAVRIGVATHNLYTAGMAYELGKKRGVLSMMDSEMLQGMSPSQQAAVREMFGNQILYTPVVHMEDFDVAVSYLVRRLEENSAEQNFLYALFAPDEAGEEGLTPLQKQEQAFRRAVANRWDVFAGPRREQDRRTEEDGRQAPTIGRFVNEPDTDPALQPNRIWALDALDNDPGEHGIEEVTDPDTVNQAVAKAQELGAKWGAQTGDQRAEVLESIGDELARNRGKLISVAAYEANKTVTQTDPEVSEAIDFSVYYAHSARMLDSARSKFTPHEVTVVTPPWNFPIAIPTGGMMAALAAGSAVIIKPAPQVVHCAKVVVEAIHTALEAHGWDKDLVQLVYTDEGDAGKTLMSHEDVDNVILTGASDTGQLFRSWRPEMNLSAETSGKNALIITPAADPDLAIADLYDSAFGHSGQKCSAASLVIFVGAAGKSDRLRNQLLDAVRTLKVGPGFEVETTMNGLVEPPSDKLLRGLTQLDPGEKWLIKPEKLNEEGTLWSPGVRDNVQPGSWYHLNECFGPVLGIMHAETLEEAIEWQNSTGYGLTGGIHSLDDAELRYWIDNVEVGNAYVNRGITGAIVQRQSFGGWKKSVMGPGAKAGGPNYVAQFGTWEDGELHPVDVDITPNITKALQGLTDRAASKLGEDNIAWLWRAAELDQLAWQSEFSREHDRTGLIAEANIFRYRPLLDVLRIRVNSGYQLRDVVRQKLAALITGAEIRMSAPADIAAELSDAGIAVISQDTAEFAAEVAHAESARIRALGEVEPEVYEAAVKSNSVVLAQPVLADGRRELLPYLLEQAVTVTMHRFGIIRTVAGIER